MQKLLISVLTLYKWKEIVPLDMCPQDSYQDCCPMDMSLSVPQDMVKDREAWRATVWGHKELDTTKQLNNNKGGSCV